MDTFEGVKFDPISLHKYLYANVNPVNNIDPSGKFTLLSVLTVLVLIAILVDYMTAPRTPYIHKNGPFQIGKIVVSIGINIIQVLDIKERIIFHADVVTGAGAPGQKYETPVGHFKAGKWKKDKKHDVYGPKPWSQDMWGNSYGPWYLPIYHLNGTYTTIGFHGTPGPIWNIFVKPPFSELYTSPEDYIAWSHGCIRMSNFDIVKLHSLIPNAEGIDIFIKN